MKKNYIIAIAKENALFPRDWMDQTYPAMHNNFDVFFQGKLTEKELDQKFHEAIFHVIDTFGRGRLFRPVFVFAEDGTCRKVEGSSNIKVLGDKE